MKYKFKVSEDRTMIRYLSYNDGRWARIVQNHKGEWVFHDSNTELSRKNLIEIAHYLKKIN